MNADQVIQKILSDAQAQADQIKLQAQKVVDAHNAQLKRELDDYNERSKELAQKAAQDKKSRMLAAIRMDISRSYLAAKGEILDQVFKKVAEKFKNLSDDQYRALMADLLKKSVETGDEEVIVDRNETRLDQEFIKNINRELGNGFKGNLRLSDSRENIKAGFILKRGLISTNASMDVLIDQARKETEIELAKISNIIVNIMI